jgi:hypothetical protein
MDRAGPGHVSRAVFFSGQSGENLAVGKLLAAGSAVLLHCAGIAAQEPRFPLPQFPAGISARRLFPATLNGDANVDLIAADTAFDQLSILVATGPAKFAPPVYFAVPHGVSTVEIADINLDGFSDALVLSKPGSSAPAFLAYLGDGAGGLAAPILCFGASGGNDIAAGDINNNGAPDALVLNLTSIDRYFGDGVGNFSSATTIPIAFSMTASVALGDLDNNGNLDVIFCGGNGAGYVGRLLGDGAGGFGAAFSESAGGNPRELRMADIDHDGYVDAVVTNDSTSKFSVIRNNGSGAFFLPFSVPCDPLPNGIVVFDANGDAHPDVATGSLPLARVTVHTNSFGAFSPGPSCPAGANPQDVCSADFNGDGIQDLAAAASQSRSISILLRDAAGNVVSPAQLNAGAQPQMVAIGDVNHDGAPDLVSPGAGSNDVTIHFGDGLGGVAALGTFASSFSPQAVALADFDNDTNLDAVVALYLGNALRFHRGNGGGWLTDAGYFPIGVKPQACVAADFNGDGLADAAAANSGSGTVSVLLGSGGMSFSSNVAYAVGSNPRSLALGDANGDGRLDLICGNNGSSTISVLLCSASGTFAAAPAVPALGPIYSVAAGELTGDGLLDIATNHVQVFRGLGGGAFSLSSAHPVANLVTGVLIDDINQDGWSDVITTNYDFASMGVLANAGAGLFLSYEFFTLANSCIASTTRDLDLDGRPDVATAILNGNQIAVSLQSRAGFVGVSNYGIGTFGCVGQLALATNAAPLVGNSSFGIVCTNAAPSSMGLLLIANAASASGFDPLGLGFVFHVDPFAATELLGYDAPSGAAGTSFVNVPIPNIAALVGATYYAQGIWAEPPGKSCGPSWAKLVSSRGLKLDLQ